MAKTDGGAHGGKSNISKMPHVGLGEGFKNKGDALKNKKKPGEPTVPKGNKKKQDGAGNIKKKK